MTTPICDFAAGYAASGAVRMHMPGHKGAAVLGPEPLDITEITGADVLYHEDGILQESQRNASRLFGTARTLYSAEGSSLAIRAMLWMVSARAAKAGRRPRILAGRNAHKVFINTSALLDIDVEWLWPEGAQSLTQCTVTPEQLEARLSRQVPDAVYITSPDYLGDLSDIAGLSRVCREHGCLLLVDNAHGAYLRFLEQDRHPISLGADLCCDSAHKTLPALTGAAYLHISPSADPFFAGYAPQAMALFASTSPSYLILQSLDRVNAYLEGDFRRELALAEGKWTAFRVRLREAGFELAGQEPLKLTIRTGSRGYTGIRMAQLLEGQGIFSEFADPDHLVWMLPVRFPEDLPDRLYAALTAIEPRSPLICPIPAMEIPVQVLSPHQALYAPSRECAVSESAGCIMASAAVSCPPAIPVVSLGERISSSAVQLMEYYGISHVRTIIPSSPEASE